MSANNRVETLSEIDRVWNENVSDFPIQRTFLSDSYLAFYAGEERTFALFIVLSILAMGIATFVMALATTFQCAWTAAVANPVDALRAE